RMAALARQGLVRLDGLTRAIGVDQGGSGEVPRASVGGVSDTVGMLWILSARQAAPDRRGRKAYSFSVASASGVGALTKAGRSRARREFTITGGMCVRCEGRGAVSEFDVAALVDRSKSLAEGAIRVPGYSMDGWYGRIYLGSGFFEMDKPVGEFSDEEWRTLLHLEPTKIKAEGINVTFEGLIPKIQKSMLVKDVEAMQPHIRAFVERAVVFTTCPE